MLSDEVCGEGSPVGFFVLNGGVGASVFLLGDFDAPVGVLCESVGGGVAVGVGGEGCCVVVCGDEEVSVPWDLS